MICELCVLCVRSDSVCGVLDMIPTGRFVHCVLFPIYFLLSRSMVCIHIPVSVFDLLCSLL